MDVSSCLRGINLHEIQVTDVEQMLASKRAMAIYDTGLGKTYIAAAIMRALFGEDGNNRCIYVVKKDQLIQTPEKIRQATGMSVRTFSSSGEDLDRLEHVDYEFSQVIMVTHQCLLRKQFMDWMFKNRQYYSVLIIDEAHELSNISGAQSSIALQAMANSFEYCYALTATPITTDLAQLVRLSALVDGKRFGNTKKLARDLRHDPNFIEKNSDFYIKRTRADFGSEKNYHGEIIWVDPQDNQQTDRYDVLRFKGPGAENQSDALIGYLLSRSGKRGLVFVNMHKIRDYICQKLDCTPIRYRCINGETSQDERKQVMREFNEDGTVDVVITSVTTAIDLDCDFVVFYEFTTNVKQMIGRAHRGLGDKCLEIVYIITDDSPEVDFFMNNIWSRCELTARVLAQDNAGLEDIRDEIVSKEQV